MNEEASFRFKPILLTIDCFHLNVSVLLKIQINKWHVT